MKDAVNMVKLVEELARRSRGRACIVLTHDYPGQKPWAAELAMQTGAKHLDLLEIFAQNPDLADHVSTFSVGSLFDYVRQHRSSTVLIVSGMEFLKAAWSAQPHAMQEFTSRLEKWQQSPALLFLIQFDPVLVETKFTRFPHLTFLVDQRETLALT